MVVPIIVSERVDKKVWLVLIEILVLVLMPMLVDYFNRYACACNNLLIVNQAKINGETSLVFIELWLGIYIIFFGCLQKSTRLCYGRIKSLKTSKMCSFLLDFIL
jgi:hypothetical protein